MLGHELCLVQKKAYDNWLQLRASDRTGPCTESTDFTAPLYLMSSDGVSGMVRYLVDLGADVNAQGGPYGNAMQAASYKGHESVVQLLLNLGADVDTKGGAFGNALVTASWAGKAAVVRLLLQWGADITQVGVQGDALQTASTLGYDDVIEVLEE